MGAPEIILICLYALSFGINLAKHGQTFKYHAGYSFFNVFIVFGLLIWGGFFN